MRPCSDPCAPSLAMGTHGWVRKNQDNESTTPPPPSPMSSQAQAPPSLALSSPTGAPSLLCTDMTAGCTVDGDTSGTQPGWNDEAGNPRHAWSPVGSLDDPNPRPLDVLGGLCTRRPGTERDSAGRPPQISTHPGPPMHQRYCQQAPRKTLGPSWKRNAAFIALSQAMSVVDRTLANAGVRLPISQLRDRHVGLRRSPARGECACLLVGARQQLV
ncbi:hypothetical protein F5Y18DRAFT_426846 [Xylariaceae sp. FL1019]|nr:hypothetical protein F5Y18DRAFT_426846 [Xylariaceae sp. FL1019]